MSDLVLIIEDRLRWRKEGVADPVLEYAFALANVFYDLYVHAGEALLQAEQIEAGREIPSNYSFHEFERMTSWFDEHDDLLRGPDRFPVRPEGGNNA